MEDQKADLESRIKTIAALNDDFRFSLAGGRIMVTSGVADLPHKIQTNAITTVQQFTAFTPDNDPYGEHDFGFFKIGDHEFFWKIDYYDPTLRHHTEDAADPEKTIRVLTIMLTGEY